MKSKSISFCNPFLLKIFYFSLMLTIPFFSARKAFSEKPKELTLLECIEIALERNPAIQSAKENVIKARLQIKEAYSSILPKLSTSFQYTHLDTHDESLDPNLPTSFQAFFSTPDDSYDFNVDLSQPLYDKGKFSVLKKQAGLGVEISKHDLESVTQEVILGTISAYLNILKAQEAIVIATESRDRLIEHLRVTKRRFEVGQVAKNDVLRAEMELANAESGLIHAQKAVTSSREHLQKILFIGEEPFTILPITHLVIEEKDLDEMVAFSYQKRPDYLKVNTLKELAMKGISLAKTDFLPLVSLFGQYKRSGEDFFPDDDDVIVGGRVELPIFEGGIRWVRLSRARSDLAISKAQETDLKRQIKVEVVDAQLHLEDLKATLKAIDKQIEHARENLRIVQLRYQEGEATNLDALDANLLLVKARTDFSTLNYDIIKARFAILKAIGDLGIDKIRKVLEDKSD